MEQLLYLTTAFLNGGIELPVPMENPMTYPNTELAMHPDMQIAMILGFIAVGMSIVLSIMNK